MGVLGSTGRRADPLSAIAIVTGVAGAVCSGILWIYQVNPGTRLLGERYSAQIAGGGPLASQLQLLALMLGTVAIVAAIFSAFTGGGGAAFGIVFGVIALSYPVLTYLNVVSSPLRNSVLGR